jgi:hypothetical protein
MPTASVKPYISDDRTRAHVRPEVWLAAAVLAALIVVAVLAPRLQPGPFVHRVTLVNHSEYAFDVDVAGGHAGDWMPLGTVAERESVAIASVFDQGSRWTFRFSVQGRDVGEIVESRADLASNRWQVDIPERFIAELHDQRIAPTA